MIDINKIREARDRLKNRMRSQTVDFWYPKVGKNKIRILKPLEDDVPPHKDAGDHYVNGKYYRCPKILYDDPCPICELAEELSRSKDEDCRQMSKELGVDGKCAWIVIVLDDNEEEMRPLIWVATPKISLTLVNWLVEGYYGDFTDIKEGRPFLLKKEIKGEGRGKRKTMYEISPLDKEVLTTDKALLKRILNEIPSFSKLSTKSYEELEKIVSNLLGGSGVDAEKQEDATKSKDVDFDLKKTEKEDIETRSHPKCFGKEYDKNDDDCGDCDWKKECKESFSGKDVDISENVGSGKKEKEKESESDNLDDELTRIINEARKTKKAK